MAFRPVAAITALLLALMATSSSDSHAAEAIVMGTVAAKSVLEEIAPAFERDSRQYRSCESRPLRNSRLKSKKVRRATLRCSRLPLLTT